MAGHGRLAPDITGMKFGRLLVIGRSKRRNDNKGQSIWDCLCDCGRTNMVRARNLRSGETQSCGCIRSEMSRAKMLKLREIQQNGKAD